MIDAEQEITISFTVTREVSLTLDAKAMARALKCGGLRGLTKAVEDGEWDEISEETLEKLSGRRDLDENSIEITIDDIQET